VVTDTARPPQTHRQDRLQYTAPLASAQCYYPVSQKQDALLLSITSPIMLTDFCSRDAQHSAAIAVATWLAVCLSHAGIVSKRLNIFENFFDHLVAPSFLFFFLTSADTHFQGEPLQRGRKIHGGGTICDFRLKSPFILERYEISKRLWNVNRKLWVPDRTASFSMCLSDPNPGFKVMVYLQVEYLKNSAFLGTKLVTIEH